MKYIDFILAIPLIWGAFIGFKKGLVLELASFVALFLGIFGAIKFSDFTANYLSQYVEVPTEWLGLTSFIVTFIIIVIGVFFLAKLLNQLLKMVALGLINRLLGMLFGILKYALMLSILLYFYENFNRHFHYSEKELAEESLLYQPIMFITKPLHPLLKEFTIEKAKEQGDKFLDDRKPITL